MYTTVLVQMQEFHSLTAMMCILAHAVETPSGCWYSQTFAFGKLENIYS